VTEVHAVRRHAAQSDSSEAVEWVRANWVTIVGLILIVAQLWLKAQVLSHAFFRVDDYFFIDWSLSNHLTWHFLGSTYDGHLMPGSYLLVWMLSRLSVYDWTLVSIVDVVLVAAACLALFRLLRTLFGNRPAILIPLAVYLFSPVMAPGLSFWATALQWLPTQLAMCMAINAQVVYARTGRFRHAAHAAAWIVAGLAFDELNAFVPVLLFALTSGFFASDNWGRAAVATLRKYWRAWVLYAAIAAGYVALYLHQLPTSYQQPQKPGQFANVLTVASLMARVTFIPVALGGPWHWTSLGDWALAAEFPPLTELAWSVALLVVLVSLWYRRHAVRAWIILAAWVALTAIVPVVVGRVGLGISPQVLGTDVHYLADSLPVIAVCVGLAFWPMAGEENGYRARPQPLFRQVGATALVVVYLAGSLWSYANYESVTSTAVSRSYLATARVAVAEARPGSVLVDSIVPQQVFPFGGHTSVILRPFTEAAPDQHLTWTTAPSGVLPSLLMFDWEGRLRAAVLTGRSVAPAKGRRGCWTVAGKPTSIPMGSPVYDWSWELGLTYHGPAATLAVDFGGQLHDVQLPAGDHVVYLAVHTGASSMTAQVVGDGPAECISHLTIGEFEPSILARPIPAAAVKG